MIIEVAIKKNLARILCFCLSILALTAPCVAEPTPAVAKEPAAAAIALAEKKFSTGMPPPEWVDQITSLPNPADKSPLTIRLSDVYFYVDKEISVFTHRALQANEAAMLAQIGQLEISFHADYQRVSLHLLRVHRGKQVFDKLKEADIRFLRREPELEAGIYGGSVTAAIVLNDLRVGDTIEIAYTIIGKNPVFGDKFFDSAAWDTPYPTTMRRVTINAPASRTIHHRMIGAEQKIPPQPNVSSVAGRRIVRYAANALPASEYESNTPRDYQSLRWLQFSEFNSWQDVRQWAESLFFATSKPAALHDALTPIRDVKSQSESVSKALEFVQKNIRYLSVSIGENSHRPYMPEQVLARRYGDCKDKSLLLVTMLRQLGIEATPALVSTYYKKNLDQMLPSPQLFDHVITRAVVQGKVYFLDPTRLGQTGNLNRMGQAHAYTQALVIAPDTNALVSVDASGNDELITNTRIERITVKKMDEPVQMSVQLRYHGVEAEAVRNGIAQLSTLQLHKFYAGNISKRHPDAVLLGAPDIQDEPGENRITVALQFQINDFFVPSAGQWSFQFKADNMSGLFYIPSDTNRNTPLDVPSFPSINRYQLEVNLPEEFDARYSPTKRNLQDPVFSLDDTLSFSGKQLNLTLEMKVKQDRVSAKEVPVFMANLNKASKMINGTLNIRRSDLKASRINNTSDVPFKKTVVEYLERIIHNTRREISDAKLTGRDPGPAQCEQARAMAYLGRKDEAKTDIQNTLKQQHLSPEALRCLAEVELANGDLKSSELHFTRALSLGMKDASASLHRGMTNFFLGKYTAAFEDFKKAHAFSDNPLDKTRAGIWQILALRRSGKPPGAMEASGNDASWQSTALAMLANQQTPESVLRLVHQESGERLETALVEAYFYLGHHYLFAGDKIKARVYFQQALDKGVLYSQYHVAAHQELLNLK